MVLKTRKKIPAAKLIATGNIKIYQELKHARTCFNILEIL
jgi:hypothetical protein